MPKQDENDNCNLISLFKLQKWNEYSVTTSRPWWNPSSVKNNQTMQLTTSSDYFSDSVYCYSSYRNYNIVNPVLNRS